MSQKVSSDRKKYPSDNQIRKGIRLSDDQAENWDSDAIELIRWLLTGEKGENKELVRRLQNGSLISSNESSDDRFKKGFSILAKALNFVMTKPLLQKEFLSYFKQDTDKKKEYAIIINLIRGETE